MNSIRIGDLYQLGGGLNIEGGFPANDLNKKSLRSNKIWANLVLVLDRPLIDNIVFDDIMKNNPYPLLENALDDINEHQLLFAYLIIIAYYIDQGRELIRLLDNDEGRELIRLLDNEKLKITIHVHQDVNCLPLIEIIKNQLDDFANAGHLDLSQVEIDFRRDDGHYQKTSHNYDGTHILISLSQCAGLDPKLPAGALIIPNEFIPYDIDSKTVYPNEKYTVKNDLLEINRLKEILSAPYNSSAMEYINTQYKSYNNEKNQKYKANLMKVEDFVITPILQVNKLWNPTDQDEKVNIL